MALVHLNYQHAGHDRKGLKISISLSDFRKGNHIKECCFVSYGHTNSFHVTFDNFMATSCIKIKYEH
jgi:hypothetical protein